MKHAQRPGYWHKSNALRMPTNPWWLWLVYAHTHNKSSHIFPCLVSHNSKHSITASQHPVSYPTLDARAHYGPWHEVLAQCAAVWAAGESSKGWKFGEWVAICALFFFGGWGWEAEDTKSRHSPGLLLAQWRSYSTWRPWAPCLHPLSLYISCHAGLEFATALFTTLPRTIHLRLSSYYTPPSVAMPF